MMSRLSRGALAACAILFLCGPLAAQGFTAGAIEIERPWARTTPGDATAATGYLTLSNHDSVPDRLVSASAGEIADSVSMHETFMQDGALAMRPLPDGIHIAPLGGVALKPGGLHLTFDGLKRPLKDGDRFEGELVFERAGAVGVVFTVRVLEGPAPAGDGAAQSADPAPGDGHGDATGAQ